MKMSRREFAVGALAASVLSQRGSGGVVESERVIWQREIDEVSPAEYRKYLVGGETAFPALKRLDEAFVRASSEARESRVEDRPAVWLVYNMGLLVKSRETFFSVDLCHRFAPTIVGELDFALITHNHDDHFTRAFFEAMDGRAHKTVVNNFDCNYGALETPYRSGTPSEFGGGYTRGGKVFKFRDVEVRTSVSDHNAYLIGYNMPFEITVGGFTIFHTGDCCNVEQLNPSRSPDLWVVHPRNRLDPADGVRRFRPRMTVVAHLNEFTHPVEKFRWSWDVGLQAKQDIEKAGGRAIVPAWGERIV